MQPTQIHPTFIVGLGGVGNKVLRLVHERFLATSQKGAVPDIVRLRSIDTTAQGESWADYLPERMYTRIGDFNANEVVDHLDSYPEIARWYTYAKGTFTPGFIDSGAKARRPVGRICFFQKFSAIRDALETDFAVPKNNDLREKLLAEGLEVTLVPRVYLVGSLSGGTCSGMFIDTAFLVRELLQRLGYTGIQLTGIFALPSAIHVDSRDGDTDVGLQRQLNSIGALQELDALMHSWEHGSRELYYPQFGRFFPSAPLFNQVFFVSQTKQDGMRFASGKDILIRLGHFLYSMANAAIGGGVRDTQVNVPDKLDPSQRRLGDGQIGVYCTVGAEWLEIPMDDLIRRYADKLGPKVAANLRGDTAEPTAAQARQDLVGRLPDKMTGFKHALDLLARSGDSLVNVRGLEDLESLTSVINEAEKKKEIERALRQFLDALPASMANLRSQIKVQTDPESEDRWLGAMRREWVSLPDVGVSGAVARFKAASELMKRLDTEPTKIARSVEDVLDDCGGGLLRRTDPAPAYEYALATVRYEVGKAIQTTTGDVASRLSVKLMHEASRLERVETAVIRRLRDLTVPGNTLEPTPPEMWMIDPDAVVASMAERIDDMVDKISAAVRDRLNEQVLADDTEWDDWSIDELEQHINVWVIDAIKYVATSQIRRPDDIVERLQRRMSACYPMVEADGRGAYLFREFFGTNEDGAPVEIKIVSTSVADDQRTKLEEWANREKSRSGSQYAFQISPSQDHSRDDLLNLSIGWPLWLFSEVRSDWARADQVRSAKPGQYAYSLVMNEFPDVTAHSFRPMDKSEMHRFLGIALTLAHVAPTSRMDSIEFDQGIFGIDGETIAKNGSIAQMFKDAQSRFEQAGLARLYKAYLGKREESDEGVLALKEEILAELAKRRERLDANREGLGTEASKFLDKMYGLAEEYAKSLMVF